MSIDSCGIIGSDTAHDVYNEVLDLYDAGATVKQIRAKVAALVADQPDDLEIELCLAAACRALWEIGQPLEPWRTRLRGLIERGTSLKLWKQAGDAALSKARLKVLSRFLDQIATPRKSPRARRKHAKVAKKLFAVGDCLELVVRNKTWRSVVCEIIEYRGRCEYAMLVMSPKTRSFPNGLFYGRKIPSTFHRGGFEFGPHVIRPEHRMLIRENSPFKVVDKVHLDPRKFGLGSFGGVLTLKHVIKEFEWTVKSAPAFGFELLRLRDICRD